MYIQNVISDKQKSWDYIAEVLKGRVHYHLWTFSVVYKQTKIWKVKKKKKKKEQGYKGLKSEKWKYYQVWRKFNIYLNGWPQNSYFRNKTNLEYGPSECTAMMFFVF